MSNSVNVLFQYRFADLLEIMRKWVNGEASDHFLLDLEKGQLIDMSMTDGIDRSVYQ